MQQRVHQCPRVNARPGVHHHTGGFIDSYHVRVFVQHRERDRFGRGVEPRRFGRFHRDGLTRAYRVRGPRRRSIQQHAAAPDPTLDPGTAEFGQALVQHLVQPLAGLVGFHIEEHGNRAVRCGAPII